MASDKAIQETPKSVQIGPFEYGIEFDSDSSYDYDYLGIALYRSRRIKLDPNMSDTELEHTLLHEVIHALGNAYEIRDWSKHTVDNEGRVTDKIDLMTTALLMWMRANPEIVQWMIK